MTNAVLLAMVSAMLFIPVQIVFGLPSITVSVCLVVEMLMVKTAVDKKDESVLLFTCYFIAVIIVSFGPDRLRILFEAFRDLLPVIPVAG